MGGASEKAPASNTSNTDNDVTQPEVNTNQTRTPPPDGGWGWVVVISSFTISLLVDGVCFSFGIFFEEFQREFGTGKGETSWIGSVMNGSYLIFGPVISALVNIWGCRSIAMSGAVVAFIALFISTFSPNIGVFIFTYGFLGGIGFGLMYLPAIVIVGYYFDRRRALATGIACCGSGIGAFLFAPLSEYLLKAFGWRGANWILAALIFHGVLVSIFYRPIPTSVASAKNSDQSKLVNQEDMFEKDKVYFEQEKQVNKGQDGSKNERVASTRSDAGLKPQHRSRSLTLYPSTLTSDKDKYTNNAELARLAYSQDFQLFNRKKTPPKKPDQSPLARKDVFYSGSLWRLKEFQELGSMEEFREKMQVPEQTTESQLSSFQTFLKTFKGGFDISLLTSPTFLIYGASCFLCMTGFFVPFIYMPSQAVNLGMDTQSAAFLISIIGITNTVGRVAVGFISDQPWADCLIINNAALILGGVATIFVPFFSNYHLLAVYSAVFGSAIAVFVSLRSIIMVELMGLEKLTTAFGFVIMARGMSSFIGSPLAGALSDSTGNDSAAFYMAGVTLTLSGLICLPLRRVAVWEKDRKRSEYTSVNQSDSSNNNNNNGGLTQEFEVKATGNATEYTSVT
ncbi:LOW QUALITY PROTEIN: monocarboxylate transporter 12-like [Physella acuta]|uniref:LOW QUALITY PROTEIN: monocarboxylate transporter 12-like n=1 Tax=Physella acuta TaxID=109671 RepID=UPI0027DD124F|nr:LOW QUALITY PROTEIN: monocarboxylate transporter 12-like [Physella acuta]